MTEIPQTRKRTGNSFPFKLYSMLEEAASTRPEHRYKVVAWSEDGESFSIYNHEEFMKQFVSRYFKLSKYRSFTRQLNIWGFTHLIKRGHDEWGHRYFIRGRFDLLKEIARNSANDANKRYPISMRPRPQKIPDSPSESSRNGDSKTASTVATYHEDSAASSGHYLVHSRPGYRLCFVPNSYLANLYVSGREAAASFPPADDHRQRGGENRAGPAASHRTSAATVSPASNDDRRNWSYDQWVRLGKSSS